MTDDKFKSVPLAFTKASPVPNCIFVPDKTTCGTDLGRFQPCASPSKSIRVRRWWRSNISKPFKTGDVAGKMCVWQAILSRWVCCARIGPHGADISHETVIAIPLNPRAGQNNRRNNRNGVEQT
jgi:hypothetical protein